MGQIFDNQNVYQKLFDYYSSDMQIKYTSNIWAVLILNH